MDFKDMKEYKDLYNKTIKEGFEVADKFGFKENLEELLNKAYNKENKCIVCTKCNKRFTKEELEQDKTITDGYLDRYHINCFKGMLKSERGYE